MTSRLTASPQYLDGRLQAQNALLLEENIRLGKLNQNTIKRLEAYEANRDQLVWFQNARLRNENARLIREIQELQLVVKKKRDSIFVRLRRKFRVIVSS